MASTQEKKSEFQMRFEPKTLHDLAGREPCKVNVRAQSKGRTHFFLLVFHIAKVLLRLQSSTSASIYWMHHSILMLFN